MTANAKGYAKVAALILDDWARELADRLSRPESEVRAAGLSAADYPAETLEVRFADDSTAVFRFAFAIVSRDKNAVAVFSGHSGHYVLPAPVLAYVRRQGAETLFDHAAWLRWGSNSTPHTDARGSASPSKGPAARAGGRGR
jgi:hypothetical protein